MNEKQKYTYSKNNETNLTSTKSLKKNMTEKVKKFQIFICMKQCFKKLIKKYEYFLSKCSINSQILMISIPFSLFLYFAIFFGNYYGYERFLKFDFYSIIKNEYLKYLINDIEDIQLNLEISEIKSKVEDLDNIYFFNIYFKELISMGLLNEDPLTKIYPNISQISETYFKNHDEFQNENKVNNIYSIPKIDCEKYIDNRNDSLSEIGKIYYYMLPYITFEAFTKKIYINETFLIAYELNKNNRNIINNELYFSFPKLKTELQTDNNFSPTNNFISPHVVKDKTKFGEKINNSYYAENWFIKQDYEFREKAHDLKNYKLSFSNLIYDYYGKLNKSNILISQNYINSNKTSYIINIIFFINKKELTHEKLQHSIFLLFNTTNNINEKEKYSDNNTFLISKSNILELSLSSKINDYFYYGMNDKNNNFYKYGVSFDSFDLDNLGEPIKNYKSTEFLNVDLKHFSSLYLYGLLFKNLKYEEVKEEFKDITKLKFEKNEKIVNKICSEYNFSLYINFLIKNDLDCWDDQTLLYYSNETSQITPREDIALGEYISRPYCICLPLFCLKNNQKDLDLNNIEYFDEIILPSECQNYDSAYLNNIDELYKEHSVNYSKKVNLNYGINDLNIFIKDIKTVLEEEFYIFKNIKLNQFNGISMMIVTFVENSDLNSLISLFIIYINLLKTYFLLFILIGMFIAFLIFIFFIFRKINKISNVINDYQKIYEKFISQLEETSKTNLNGNNIINKISENKINNSNYEYYSFIKSKTINLKNKNINTLFYSNENMLLNDLFALLCKYYNISKVELIKKSKNVKEEDDDENYDLEENELFYFLRILSIYIPKFKLQVTMDYNFYINSKLNNNFMKTCTKNFKKNSEIVILTQSVIFELLSTENIEDCGIITNFYFKYLTNINLYSRIDNNSIKKSLFKCVKERDNEEEEFLEKNINNNKLLIEEKDNKKSFLIIRREENKILDEFESNFENDDYLKKDKLLSCFDSFLINVYYKNIKKLTYKYEGGSFQY